MPQTKVLATKRSGSTYLFTIAKNGPKFPSSQFWLKSSAARPIFLNFGAQFDVVVQMVCKFTKVFNRRVVRNMDGARLNVGWAHDGILVKKLVV
jgi:hypothetical protein